MKIEITCVNCPRGCELCVEHTGGTDIKVTGNRCARGREFGISEVLMPMRFLTTTVALSDDMAKVFGAFRLPVISTAKIPRERLVEVSMALSRAVVDHEAEQGEVVADAMGFDFAASCRLGKGKGQGKGHGSKTACAEH